MAQLKVRTAQNVLLEYPIANTGQRILGGFLDLVVLIVYYFLASIMYSAITGNSFIPTVSDYYWRFFLLTLPILIYHPLLEYIWEGKTVGKAILKTRVVRVDGSPATLGDVVLRWLLRVIDVKLGFLFIFFLPRNPTSTFDEVFTILVFFFFLLPFPLVGIISMGTSKLGQRIGDRVANTTVVENKRPFSLEDTILKAIEEDYQPRFTNVLELSDKDIYIIKNTLDEALKTRDYKNVLLLAEKARKILSIEEDMMPLELLQTLLKDYNHLAKQRDLV